MVQLPAIERSRPTGNGINEGKRAGSVYAVVFWPPQSEKVKFPPSLMIYGPVLACPPKGDSRYG